MNEKNQDTRTESQDEAGLFSAGEVIKTQLDGLLRDFNGNAFVVVQSQEDREMVVITKGSGVEVAAMLSYKFSTDQRIRTIAEAALQCTINIDRP